LRHRENTQPWIASEAGSRYPSVRQRTERSSTPTNGFDLWKTDGTAAGTVLVKDTNPEPA